MGYKFRMNNKIFLIVQFFCLWHGGITYAVAYENVPSVLVRSQVSDVEQDLLIAIQLEDIDAVKVCLKSDIKNIDKALKLAVQIGNKQIIDILRQYTVLLKRYKQVAVGSTIAAAVLVLSLVADYICFDESDNDFNLSGDFSRQLDYLLHKKIEWGEETYDKTRHQYSAIELYEEYQSQVQGIVYEGVHPHSDEDKAKVVRIFMSLQDQEFISKHEVYKDIFVREKAAYDRTEGLFKQSLERKEKSSLTPTEEICLKYMQVKPGLLYAWVTRFEAETHISEKTSDTNCREAMFVDFVRVMEGVAKHEKEVIDQGYIPFAHGRNWEFNFLKDVYNFVEAIEQGKSEMSDEIKLRYRGINHNRVELEQWREDLVQYGVQRRCESGTGKSGKDSEITYLARTPLSNASLVGENSLRLFLTNFSYARGSKVLKIAQAILDEHGLSSCYDGVAQLYAAHAACNTKNYGELLTVGIKPEYVDEIAYVAKPCGYKYDGLRPKTVRKNLEACRLELQKDEQCLDTDGDFCIQRHGYDARIYCAACLTLPGEFGKKYTMKSTHLADSTKMQDYKQKWQAFFEQQRVLQQEKESLAL